MKIVSLKKTNEIIKKYDFVFRKKYGQNFLVDESILEEIIDKSNINKEDVVIEVGAGIGTLTEVLSEKAFKVIAVEIDKKLIPILNDTLKDFDNIEIVNQDILKFDISVVIEKYKDKNIKVVANLPYYITTPVIMYFLKNKFKIDTMTFMIQKEVALRMIAKPGTKDYRDISLAIQYYSNAEIICYVPQNSFIPRPKVDSAVIKLDMKKELPAENEKLMFSLIKFSFGQRRKTFVNSVYNQNSFNLSKVEIENILVEAGFDKNIRGEKLNIEDFILLSNIFSEKLK